MRLPRSLMPPSVIPLIHGIESDGFETQMRLANPPVMVQVYRGSMKVGVPTQVLVVPANRQSRQASDGGAMNVAFDGGVLRAWAPWDIDVNDAVRIGDATAVIRSTPPIRNGIQDATYEMEGGGGTNG